MNCDRSGRLGKLTRRVLHLGRTDAAFDCQGIERSTRAKLAKYCTANWDPRNLGAKLDLPKTEFTCIYPVDLRIESAVSLVSLKGRRIATYERFTSWRTYAWSVCELALGALLSCASTWITPLRCASRGPKRSTNSFSMNSPSINSSAESLISSVMRSR